MPLVIQDLQTSYSEGEKVYIFKRSICFILIFALMFSLCSCGAVGNKASETVASVKDHANSAKTHAVNVYLAAKEKADAAFSAIKQSAVSTYGTAKDSAAYVYDQAAQGTSAGLQKAEEKAAELIGNAENFVASLKETPAEPLPSVSFDPQHPVRDLYAGQDSLNLTNARIVEDHSIEQFIAYYVSSILSARGYSVYNGAVYYKGDVYGGLIFTRNQPFIDDKGETINSCGFIQLVGKGYSGLRINDRIASTGLIAIAPGIGDSEETAYIVDEFAVIDAFSGIINDTYFEYHQDGHYVLEIGIFENNPANYVSGVPVFDFDSGEYLTESATNSTVEQIFSTDPTSYFGAVETINAIVDLDENSLTQETSEVFVIDLDSLDKIISSSKGKAKDVVSYINKSLKKLKIGDGQFLQIKSDKSYSVFGQEGAIDEAQVTDGFIEAAASCLGLAGSVASIVCVTTGGQIVVSAIIITTGTMAIVYNVSNILEGAQDMAYSSSGSDKDGINPVLELFIKAIGDEETAKKVYHCWGIGCTIITNLGRPVSGALKLAKVSGLNTFQTGASVIRAALTRIAEYVITGVGAGMMASYVNKVVTNVTDNESLGKLAGFGTALLTGMLLYTGLENIDNSLNISGLHPKPTFINDFLTARLEQKANLSNKPISEMEPGEVEAMMNDWVDHLSEACNLPEKPVVVVGSNNNTNVCGAYDYHTNTIYVNTGIAGTSPGDLANTIGHELCHAHQYIFSINNPNSSMAYSFPDEYYIFPASDGSNYTAYYNQLCELTAFAAGDYFESFIGAGASWADFSLWSTASWL